MSHLLIARNTIVRLEYTLKNEDGEVLDTSDGDEPLTYLHGHSQIVPGLEKQLEGRGVGTVLDVKVEASEGYGVYDPELLVKIPRSEVPADVDLEPGAPVHAENEDGEPVEFIVASVGDDEVLLDGNHPLAGVDLYFHVSVVDVRAASREEIAHGHAHGPGGAHSH